MLQKHFTIHLYIKSFCFALTDRNYFPHSDRQGHLINGLSAFWHPILKSMGIDINLKVWWLWWLFKLRESCLDKLLHSEIPKIHYNASQLWKWVKLTTQQQYDLIHQTPAKFTHCSIYCSMRTIWLKLKIPHLKGINYILVPTMPQPCR